MRFTSVVTVSLCALLCCRALALDSSNVLVLYNASSPDGLDIANYYAAAHPGVRLLGLTGITTSEEVTADYYLSAIRPQILPALDASVDVLVTTKGLPLRINTAPHTNPGTYTDPSGVSRTIYSSTWKPYSSFESELTRIDTISTWQQMGDQTYWNPMTSPLSRNPYYKQSGDFAYQDQGIRLASRLDAFNVADVKASIDRAQSAQAGSFRYVVDDDPSKSYDRMSSLATDVLTPLGQQFTYDNSSGFVGTAAGSVIGYVSHGRNQSSTPANYIPDQQNGLNLQLAPGAVFHTWESYNANSFVPGGNRSGQGLIAEWIARGGTAAVGHVEEPMASASNVTNEDLMFAGLLAGRTWAEAAWSATAQLSYVNTVVGDPLMRFFLPGDLDGNHVLNNLDIAPFELSLTNLERYAELYPHLTDWRLRGDINHDGALNNLDLAPFQRLLTSELPSVSTAVPEPSAAAHAVVVGLAACGFYLRRLSTGKRVNGSQP